MGDLSEHFSRSEMQCKCCGQCVLDDSLLPALEEFRAKVNRPVRIIDACRCEKHNSDPKVAGMSNSEHLFWEATPERAGRKCRAADVEVIGLSMKEVYDFAEQIPAFKDGGIGVYSEGSIHLDTRDGRARWARVHGKYMSIAESKLLE